MLAPRHRIGDVHYRPELFCNMWVFPCRLNRSTQDIMLSAEIA
jgi:hypothetical protein